MIPWSQFAFGWSIDMEESFIVAVVVSVVVVAVVVVAVAVVMEL